MTLTAVEMIRAIEEVQARCPVWTSDLASDGPPVDCVAAVDLDAMADEAEARETRWREGAA